MNKLVQYSSLTKSFVMALWSDSKSNAEKRYINLDKTNNITTSQKGRYLRMIQSDDRRFEFTLDFNFAINLDAEYDQKIQFSLIPKGSSLDFYVKTGENKYKTRS